MVGVMVGIMIGIMVGVMVGIIVGVMIGIMVIGWCYGWIVSNAHRFLLCMRISNACCLKLQGLSIISFQVSLEFCSFYFPIYQVVFAIDVASLQGKPHIYINFLHFDVYLNIPRSTLRLFE